MEARVGWNSTDSPYYRFFGRFEFSYPAACYNRSQVMIRLRHLNMASRFLARRFRKLHPYEVQAVLLNACNLRCVYCRCPDVQTTLLTTEQWRWIIRSLGRLGTLRIKFQGGEPTIRKD